MPAPRTRHPQAKNGLQPAPRPRPCPVPPGAYGLAQRPWMELRALRARTIALRAAQQQQGFVGQMHLRSSCACAGKCPETPGTPTNTHEFMDETVTEGYIKQGGANRCKRCPPQCPHTVVHNLRPSLQDTALLGAGTYAKGEHGRAHPDLSEPLSQEVALTADMPTQYLECPA
eukprot:gene13566-biopygen11078